MHWKTHHVTSANAVARLDLGCMLCAMCASSVLDLGQMSHSLRLFQTLRAMHAGFQDLCVKVESTAELVTLVSKNQRDEKLARRAINDKLLQEVEENASKLEVSAACDAIRVPLCFAYGTCEPCSGVLLASAACVFPCMCLPVYACGFALSWL